MHKAGETGVKASLPEAGMRKVWITFAVIGTLLVGLVIAMAFGKMTDGMWTAWCAALAGSGGLYATANVVTKVVTKEK